MNSLLEENGFVIIENLYSKDQIDKMREISLDFFSSGGGFDNSGGIAKPGWIEESALSSLYELCGVDSLALKISKIVKEEVSFVGHNDLHMNRSVGWHKDRLNGKARCFEKNSPWDIVNGQTMKIFKLNIYLQDHSKDEDGLCVRVGSHKVESMSFGEKMFLCPKKGDAVLFDQRITHRSNWSGDYNRLLICFGFGVENVFFDQFKEGTFYRQDIQKKLRRF